MKKPVAIVVSRKTEERKKISDLLKNGVSRELGMDFEIKSYEERERMGNGGQLYIATSLDSNSSEQRFARRIRNEEPHCARLLVTNTKGLIDQDIENPNSSLLSNYLSYKGESSSIDWKDFKKWFREYYPTFQDIVIEDKKDKNSLKIEIKNAIDYLREKRKIYQPITIGLDGLGAFGMGTLEKAVRGNCVSCAYVHSDFVEEEYKSDYNFLLNSLDLSGEEKEKIFPGSREEIFDAQPDVFIIARGKRGVDYSKYKTRAEIIEIALKTGIPKIDPILDEIINKEYPGLVAVQSNPNGHLIYYAMKRGIDKSQLTSFPPDTIRHRAELYEELKKFDPKIKEEDIELEAIGEHMTNGGTPLYYSCKVKGKPLMKVFPQMNDQGLQEAICKRAQRKGLLVMQSAEEFRHDYRGVPERIRECLSDIAHYREYTRYPIYTGILSGPARFTYQGKGDKINPRIQGVFTDINNLTRGDKKAEAEMRKNIKEIMRLTKPHVKPKS